MTTTTCTRSATPLRDSERGKHFTGVNCTLPMVTFIGAYFATQILVRWLKFPLFGGAQPYSWESPSNGELVLLVLATLAPLMIWLPAARAFFSVFHPATKMLIVPVAGVAILMVIEMNMSWFEMSHHHATLEDVRLLFTSDWGRHIGLRQTDMTRLLRLFTMHSVALAGICVAAHYAAHWPIWAGLSDRLRGSRGVVLILIALTFDGAVVAYNKTRAFDPERSQWWSVIYANPIRPPLLDAVFLPLLSNSSHRDLANANAALKGLLEGEPAETTSELAIIPRVPARASLNSVNVLLIAVESFNPRFVDHETMPYLSEVASHSVELRRHYSSGNGTHLGILGLLFGDPPFVFGREKSTGYRKSPYLDCLSQHGYQTRMLSMDVALTPIIGENLQNFTAPTFVSTKADAVVEKFRESYGTDEDQFTFIFYFDTHFPYRHSQDFAVFVPEVDEDFDYANCQRYREQIQNRYRNCLRQLDQWLERLLAIVDLSRTVVIITGDHGEEFFEFGRLGHAAYLDEAQIRVPCIIHCPGGEGFICNDVTSHCDVMPTVLDLCGLSGEVATFGRSVFHAGARPHAIVGNNNQMASVKKWAAITAEGKAVFVTSRDVSEIPTIVGFYDEYEHRLPFRDGVNEWQHTLRAISEFWRTSRNSP